MGLFSHYHDLQWQFDNLILWVHITLSSPHRWVAPDQSPGSSGRSLHWLPCLKASGLCDHNVIIVMMAIDKQRPPVYNPCRMNILKASHNLVDDELHLKIISWEVFCKICYLWFKWRWKRVSSLWDGGGCNIVIDQGEPQIVGCSASEGNGFSSFYVVH